MYIALEGYPERQPENSSSNTSAQDTSYIHSQSLITSSSVTTSTTTTNTTETKPLDKPAKRRRFTEKVSYYYLKCCNYHFTFQPTIQPEILKVIHRNNDVMYRINGHNICTCVLIWCYSVDIDSAFFCTHMQSSLSVNTYTDQAINSQPIGERVSDQVKEEDKLNKDHLTFNKDTVDSSKGQLVEENDKWKSVVNSKISNSKTSNKKDVRLSMPPPSGGFMFKKPSIPPLRDKVFPGELRVVLLYCTNIRLAKPLVPKSEDTDVPAIVELDVMKESNNTIVHQIENDNTDDYEDKTDDKPNKKLKLVVYGDSDSE